ncbi:MAG: hypothetical protein KBT12_02055 [Bacteroidales bacterium]|nr:hypothetical protein [Candidatus Physcousia equi]
MKKLFFLSLLLCTALCAHAQKSKKRTAAPAVPAISYTEAMQQYRFNEAEQALHAEIASLRKKNLDVSEAEAKLRAVQRAKSKIAVTEKICFIDSIVVNKRDLLSTLYLSSESGKVDSFSRQFQRPDSTGCTTFLSQMGDVLIYGAPFANGLPQLYASYLNGKDWTEPVSLTSLGLGFGDTEQNFPFMMNDGQTLYYAAKCAESLGGYDIFMTRYDAEEHRFLTPENIGMPFNSPANDYLYVVDEFNNIGWFATDRNQPADTVCVYTFIPNETRRIYNIEEVGEAQLRSLAKLNCMSDTRSDLKGYNEGVQRLLAAKNALKKTEAQKQHDFVFVINDARTYTSFADFRSADARKKAEWWKESCDDLERAEQGLQQLRDRYATSNAAARQQLAAQIIPLEQRVAQLIAETKKLEKEIRQMEN